MGFSDHIENPQLGRARAEMGSSRDCWSSEVTIYRHRAPGWVAGKSGRCRDPAAPTRSHAGLLMMGVLAARGFLFVPRILPLSEIGWAIVVSFSSSWLVTGQPDKKLIAQHTRRR